MYFYTLFNHFSMNLRIWACTLSIKGQSPLLEKRSMSSISYLPIVSKKIQTVTVQWAEQCAWNTDSWDKQTAIRATGKYGHTCQFENWVSPK